MKLYGLKTCDTCRKALKHFPNAEFKDVRADGLPEAVLNAAHEAFGAALLNTRSATWRGLDEEERAGDPVELIARHPALMKRPLIEAQGKLYLGWTPEVQAALAG
ncbi:arsenate reductase [Roseovarius spongiae]|uniref:Arsenate reductase n=1 Tax=Roseovarius spongiae TaxID=2320272 RepID=A0A3A8B5A5_9RHOB|nr:ArsC/Spx/MgsR family protein [Roseovarius spongiae]RKF17241.1 arsenate reductase [Roseovarius spongiae]